MKIEVSNLSLEIDETIVSRYQNMTGDTKELLPLSCAVLLEAQTGLAAAEVVQKFSQEQLENIITKGMLSELEAFGG